MTFGWLLTLRTVLVPGTKLGTSAIGFDFGFFRFSRREIAAKSKRNATSKPIAALTGSAFVVQVVGIEIIKRSKLKSNVPIEPKIKASTRCHRHRRIVNRGICASRLQAEKSRPILANQGVSEVGDSAGTIANRITRPNHVREVAAGDTGNVSAIAQSVAAEVSFNRDVMEESDRCRKLPSVERELFIRSQTTRWLIEMEVGIAAE